MCTCDNQLLPHDPLPGVCPEPEDVPEDDEEDTCGR